MAKINFPKISLKNETMKRIIGWKLDALIIYLIVFVIGEILISGGLYERGYVFGIVNSVLVLALALYVQNRRKIENMTTQIYRAVTMVIAYAVLDFLLVELLLERFNHLIYGFWGTYAAYAIVVLVPILYLLAPAYWEKIKANKVEKA